MRTIRLVRLIGVTLVVFLVLDAAMSGQGGRGRAGTFGQAGRGRVGAPARDAVGPAVGAGSISGSVVSNTGSPVRRARVSLTGAELRGGRTVLTDDNGQFVFPALPPGRFTMMASKAGYVSNVYGARAPGRPGTPIQLAEGQNLERTVITLPRGGVITGVVLDDRGEPAPGTPVRAMRFVMRTGEKTLENAGQDTTDDRGMYRIYQLQPGDYLVMAVPRNVPTLSEAAVTVELSDMLDNLGTVSGGRGGVDAFAAGSAAAEAALREQLALASQQPQGAYAPVYYPGTTTAASAATITLGVSEERAGVDFQLRLVPTAQVTGTVLSATGVLPQGTQVALVPADQTLGPRMPGMNITRVGQAGEFSFSNVTPGDYMVEARAVTRDRPVTQEFVGPDGRRGARFDAGQVVDVQWASAPISVSGQNLTDVVLNLQPGLTVSGRVEFAGSSTPPVDLTRVRISLSPRGSQVFRMGGSNVAQVEASGRFTIPGVSPGSYTLSAGIGGVARGGGGNVGGSFGSWHLASAMAGGRDALDFPIEVTNTNVAGVVLQFSDRRQQLSGMIQDTAGRPTSDFSIIVFPSDSRYWVPQSRRIASTRPGTDGRFSFDSLPAGEYRLTAVTDAEPGEWYDPAFLQQLRQVSIPVTLAEGQNRTQDVRVAQ